MLNLGVHEPPRCFPQQGSGQGDLVRPFMDDDIKKSLENLHSLSMDLRDVAARCGSLGRECDELRKAVNQDSKALLEAVRWVVEDASYAAPETWDGRSKRWIDRLQQALRETES